ncbi:predicted GPI-anchored protein 58 [Oncorhynchus tshawytscha]|uniref:predicted GPI-anchored protein 58 n=1 Tax=Oncorhynchus tshawytscha TaxID=74940 RepID=UPI001C3E78D8|nr:predicted GPI-anchored protein 58 [Oncorhynchus tshawytscha]
MNILHYHGNDRITIPGSHCVSTNGFTGQIARASCLSSSSLILLSSCPTSCPASCLSSRYSVFCKDQRDQQPGQCGRESPDLKSSKPRSLQAQPVWKGETRPEVLPARVAPSPASVERESPDLKSSQPGQCGEGEARPEVLPAQVAPSPASVERERPDLKSSQPGQCGEGESRPEVIQAQVAPSPASVGEGEARPEVLPARVAPSPASVERERPDLKSSQPGSLPARPVWRGRV